MPRLKKAAQVPAQRDVLEVIHHEVPETAAGAGAQPIPAEPTYRDGTGMTWRQMMRAAAAVEVVGLAALLVAGAIYGLATFYPLILAGLLFAGAVAWIPRKTKASTVYTLVIASLTLLMFGVMFFGWTGFLYPQSWFEMTFATLTTIVPIACIVAAVATLRHRTGTDSARVPATATAVVAALAVVTGVFGSAVTDDATRIPGDTTLSAQNFEFEQTALTAHGPDVAIYFDNQDPFVHNVKIDGHGVSKNANGGQAIRHVFKGLTAGVYTYFCEIHTDMKGTLTVT